MSLLSIRLPTWLLVQWKNEQVFYIKAYGQGFYSLAVLAQAGRGLVECQPMADLEFPYSAGSPGFQWLDAFLPELQVASSISLRL